MTRLALIVLFTVPVYADNYFIVGHECAIPQYVIGNYGGVGFVASPADHKRADHIQRYRVRPNTKKHRAAYLTAALMCNNKSKKIKCLYSKINSGMICQ